MINLFLFQSEKLISPKLKNFKKPPKISQGLYPSEIRPDATYHRSETKHTFHSDWIPLDTDPIAEHFKYSHSHSRHRKPNKLTTKVPVTAYSEVTTQYPMIRYETPPIYPLTIFSDVPNTFHNLHYLDNQNMKQNTIDLSQLSVLPAIEHVDAEIIASPKMQTNEDRLKNHRLSYEVTEPDSSEGGGYDFVSQKESQEQSKEKRHGKRGRRNKSQTTEKAVRQGRNSHHNRGKIRHH